MGLDYFPCYHSYVKKCEKLTDQELGRLFRALLNFSATGERQELAGRESIAFDFIADDIERAQQAYDAKCQKNAANIAKRYATDEYDGIRSNTNEYESYQSKSKSKSESKSNAPNGANISPARRFVPPTREEAEAYCAEKGYTVDLNAWFAHYESNGWKVGRNPMKDWRAAIRTWVHNRVSNGQQPARSFADMWREMDD